MKFKWYKTSTMGSFEHEIELNTLEELIEWCKENSNQNFNPNEIIINPKEMTLEIYNDYRE